MASKQIQRTRRAYREGSITQRPNGLWVGRVEGGYDRDGNRRQTTVTSMDYSVMMEKFDRAKAEIKLYGYTSNPTATLTQWTEKWLTEIADKNVRGKTYAGYASILRKWVQPTIGKRKLAKLTPDDWRAVRAAMAKENRSSTHALQCYHVLRKCLEDARREGLIHENVLTRVDPPRKAANPRGAFTAEQSRLILSHASLRHQAAIMTGARQSELLGLTWPYVDLDSPTPEIRIDWQLQELRERHQCGTRGDDGRYPCGYKQAARCPNRAWQVPEGHEYLIVEGRLALVRPKTRHGYRRVPLLPRLADALREHRANSAPGPQGLVWHNDGHPVRHKDDEAEWKALMVSVGMPEGCTLHWARHSAATMLMAAGVDTKVVGELVGHGSVAVTRVYQHVSSELARQGMNKLGELLA